MQVEGLPCGENDKQMWTCVLLFWGVLTRGNLKKKKAVTTVFIKATEKELGLMQDSSYTLS